MGKWDAELEKVVRSLLTHVKAQNGTWVAGAEALKEAMRKHPELE